MFIYVDFVSTVHSATSAAFEAHWPLTFCLPPSLSLIRCPPSSATHYCSINFFTPTIVLPTCLGTPIFLICLLSFISALLSISRPQMSGGPVDMDPLTQMLPGLKGPSGTKQGSEDPTSPGGGLQLQSPEPQPPAQLQSPVPQHQSPLSQPQSLPALQSPSPQLHSPSPQLTLQSPSQLQPSEANISRNVDVKREPPGTPNRGQFQLLKF